MPNNQYKEGDKLFPPDWDDEAEIVGSLGMNWFKADAAMLLLTAAAIELRGADSVDVLDAQVVAVEVMEEFVADPKGMRATVTRNAGQPMIGRGSLAELPWLKKLAQVMGGEQWQEGGAMLAVAEQSRRPEAVEAALFNLGDAIVRTLVGSKEAHKAMEGAIMQLTAQESLRLFSQVMEAGYSTELLPGTFLKIREKGLGA